MFSYTASLPPQRLSMAHSDPNFSSNSMDDDFNLRHSSFDPTGRLSCEGSPITMSPWNNPSPFKPSWSTASQEEDSLDPYSRSQSQSNSDNLLIGSMVRQEGHIYSLAASRDLLYTGSDSKNIRVWKNMKEFSAFKSTSGLVKAIIVAGDRIFTGHQDGKVRVWKIHPKNPSIHKRAGSLPTLMDVFKCSIKPSNYIETKRKRNSLWIKHHDAVSCLSLSSDQGLLYSASWDRTFKVWRISDSKCLESVTAHDDAVNSVVATAGGVVYSGSADGTVKVWKRELLGKTTKHVLVQTLLQQECAVTALAISGSGSVLYSGSSDGFVNFWECDKQLTHGGSLKGHKLAILCIAAAGNMVFSGSADKTICVWRREGAVHTRLSVLTGHAGPVKCLAVEKDRASTAENPRWVLYSGSLDKSVKVWSLSESACVMNQTTGSSWDSLPSVKY